jgi:hypothetical protein
MYYIKNVKNDNYIQIKVIKNGRNFQSLGY